MARRGAGSCVSAGCGVLVLCLVAAAAGEPVARWRTPQGGLWFGSSPPGGSVRLGDLERLEPLDGGGAEGEARGGGEPGLADTAREGREIIRQRAEGRAAARERREALGRAVEMATQSVTRGNLGWVIVGSVRNTAGQPVHDVRVGAGGVWASTDPVRIPPGGEATFRLEVPSYPYTEYDAVPPVVIDWNERR